MAANWLVVADEQRVRIFEKAAQDDHLIEIDDLVNPEARAKGSDLDADAKGRFYGKGERVMAHTAEPPVSKLQHSEDLFAKAVAEYLDQARQQQRFAGLDIVAFPKFLGLLRKNLSKESLHLVKHELSKDISGFSQQQIEEYVRGKMH